MVVKSEQPAAGASIATELVYAHGLAAIVTLLISVCFGIVASIQLLAPDLAVSSPWMTWGRLRYDHTQGIMLGWLGNAFFAFLYHAVPLLTGRRVTSVRLGQWMFGLWNFADSGITRLDPRSRRFQPATRMGLSFHWSSMPLSCWL